MNNPAKAYVINENETWSELKCGNCHNTLDVFYTECMCGKYCDFCGVEIIKSDYQIEYDEECDLFEKISEALLENTTVREVCEMCNPKLNPLCTQECQEVCPECINYKGN